MAELLLALAQHLMKEDRAQNQINCTQGERRGMAIEGVAGVGLGGWSMAGRVDGDGLGTYVAGNVWRCGWEYMEVRLGRVWGVAREGLEV